MLPGVGAQTKTYPAGGALTPGQAVYANTAAPVAVLAASCNAKGGSQAAAYLGIALNGAAVGQPVSVQLSGLITLPTTGVGTVLVVGGSYMLSETAGDICPVADLLTGDFPVFIGFAPNVNQINMTPVLAGVAHA